MLSQIESLRVRSAIAPLSWTVVYSNLLRQFGTPIYHETHERCTRVLARNYEEARVVATAKLKHMNPNPFLIKSIQL
jgi:hypothetical protein